MTDFGKPEFSFGTNTRRWVSALSEKSLKEKVWYHIAGQFDGDTAEVFVNGVRCAREFYKGEVGVSTTPLNIGRRGVDQPFYFYGKIEVVRISDVTRY